MPDTAKLSDFSDETFVDRVIRVIEADPENPDWEHVAELFPYPFVPYEYRHRTGVDKQEDWVLFYVVRSPYGWQDRSARCEANMTFGSTGMRVSASGSAGGGVTRSVRTGMGTRRDPAKDVEMAGTHGVLAEWARLRYRRVDKPIAMPVHITEFEGGPKTSTRTILRKLAEAGITEAEPLLFEYAATR